MHTRIRPPMNPARLDLECLEAREVPAVTILVDYSLDLRANGGSGFFEDHPDAKATMNAVAQEMGQRVDADLGAINPTGGNSWNAIFFNPENGQQITIPNLRIAADTIVVYVGGQAKPGPEAGQGGFGGYGWSGTTAWGNTVAHRGWSGFSTWGGSITFDSTENWYFGLGGGPAAGQLDFYSVVTHELGHVLGFGTASQWFADTRGSNFVGSHVQAVYGGPAPIDTADAGHWADGLTFNGRTPVMDPVLNYGERRTWTSLDEAALQDIGWRAGSSASPPVSPPPTPPTVPPPPPPPVTFPPVANRGVVLVSGAANGKVDVYAPGSDGNLAPTGQSFTPFPGFTGTIRTAVADFNGDGVADYAFATGPGTAATVRVIDGATGGDILGPTQVLGGFGGGVYIAAGDVNRDGRAELAISADAGGLPAVEVDQVVNGRLAPLASFLAFSANSRRGARVAMGDVNRDGAADLIVGAGVGQLPRVLLYDGNALAAGRATLMGPAFLAFGVGMRAGVNPAVGDVNGDGYDDLIVSQDAGGSSRVRVWSGATISASPGASVATLPTYQSFFANGLSDRSGIRVVARDLAGNGAEQLITAPAGGPAGWVRVLTVTGTSVDPYNAVFPFGSAAPLAGVYVG